MLRCPILFAVTLFLAVPLTGATASEPLRIGVSYTPPADGAPAARLYTEDGFEIALANELGKALDRPVRLVMLSGDDRKPALDAGRVDAVLARLTSDDLLRAATDVIPGSYASGLSASMRSDTTIRSWTDLEGRTVCVSEANTAAQRHLHTLGAKVRIERAPARTLAFVRTGACDAAIHDDVLLKRLFEDENWRKFSATLPSILSSELALVLPKQSSPELSRLRGAFRELTRDASWDGRESLWAANVALEVYLDQDGPDCH